MQVPNGNSFHFGGDWSRFRDPRTTFDNPRNFFENPRGGFGNPRDGFEDPRRGLGDFGCGFGDPRSNFGSPRASRGNFHRSGFGGQPHTVEFGPYGFRESRPHPYRTRSRREPCHCCEHDCGFDFQDGTNWDQENEDDPRFAFFGPGFGPGRGHTGFEFGGRGRRHHRGNGRGGYF